MSRAVGIDLGSRRIGVAVSDDLELTAQPYATVARHGGQRDLDAIAAVVREFSAYVVVLGLPVNPERGEEKAAQSARTFADRLHVALGIPVELLDESFSTVEAESILLAAGVSRAKRRQVVDKIAAAVILQRWLDGKRTRGASAANGPGPGTPA